MTADGIRTHAYNEPRTYKVLKSRQYLLGNAFNHLATAGLFPEGLLWLQSLVRSRFVASMGSNPICSHFCIFLADLSYNLNLMFVHDRGAETSNKTCLLTVSICIQTFVAVLWFLMLTVGKRQAISWCEKRIALWFTKVAGPARFQGSKHFFYMCLMVEPRGRRRKLRPRATNVKGLTLLYLRTEAPRAVFPLTCEN